MYLMKQNSADGLGIAILSKCQILKLGVRGLPYGLPLHLRILSPFVDTFTALVTDVSIILIIGGCYGPVARVMAPCQAPSRSSGAVSPEQETAGALNSGHLIMPSSLLVLLSVAHNALLESCF